MSVFTARHSDAATTPAAPNGQPLWKAMGIGLALTLIFSTFVVVRWLSHPLLWGLVTGLVLLSALCVVAFMGSRRGHTPTFVVIALVLPYLVGGAAAYAATARAADAINDMFSVTSFDADFPDSFSQDDPLAQDLPPEDLPPEDTAPGEVGSNEGATSPRDFVDDNGDGVNDKSYAGEHCEDYLNADPVTGPDRFTVCMNNGGQ